MPIQWLDFTTVAPQGFATLWDYDNLDPNRIPIDVDALRVLTPALMPDPRMQVTTPIDSGYVSQTAIATHISFGVPVETRNEFRIVATLNNEGFRDHASYIRVALTMLTALRAVDERVIALARMDVDTAVNMYFDDDEDDSFSSQVKVHIS